MKRHLISAAAVFAVIALPTAAGATERDAEHVGTVSVELTCQTKTGANTTVSNAVACFTGFSRHKARDKSLKIECLTLNDAELAAARKASCALAHVVVNAVAKNRCRDLLATEFAGREDSSYELAPTTTAASSGELVETWDFFCGARFRN